GSHQLHPGAGGNVPVVQGGALFAQVVEPSRRILHPDGPDRRTGCRGAAGPSLPSLREHEGAEVCVAYRSLARTGRRLGITLEDLRGAITLRPPILELPDRHILTQAHETGNRARGE